DIPYEYRGGMKFFERSHIKDVLAFLRVRANSRDQLAWIRILGLQVGIGPATSGRLAEALSATEEYAAALAVSVDSLLSARARAGWQEIGGTLAQLVPVTEPAEAIRIVSKSRNYQDYLEAEYPNWQERMEDLEQLAAFAERTPDMAQFLGEVNLFDDYGAAGKKGAATSGERMVLSTIHQAKGLEWDTVFVMQMTGEDFPNRRAALEEDGIEEERRLFYVAVTRAAKRLFLSYPITSGYDSLAMQQPSPFLEEVRQELFDDLVLESASRESVIVWDDKGDEIKPKRSSGGYLKDIDELLF
ncbi:MAG: ATP-dependent helicase, partial [bacterium]|nr:ATP-dependent helicase [bacterium]